MEGQTNNNLNNESLLEVQKMLFIYGAVNDGWTVRMLPNNKFEFTKSKQEVKIDDQELLSKFILKNLNINTILN